MERKIDRFLQYLDFKGITENKATVDCGLSKGLIGQAKNGKSDLGNKAIEKVLIFYQDLNKVWLITGEGEMLNSPSSPELATEHKPTFSSAEILLREMLTEERSRTDALQERINELIEENARLKTLIESERKGGVA